MSKRLEHVLTAAQLKRSTNGLLSRYTSRGLNFMLGEHSQSKVEKVSELMRNADQLTILGNDVARDYEVNGVKGIEEAETTGNQNDYVDGFISQLGLTLDEIEKIKPMNQKMNYLVNDILIASENDDNGDPTEDWYSKGASNLHLTIERGANDNLFANLYLKSPTLYPAFKMSSGLDQDPSKALKVDAEVCSRFELTTDGPILDSISYDQPELLNYFMSGSCKIEELPCVGQRSKSAKELLNYFESAPCDVSQARDSSPSPLSWRSELQERKNKAKPEYWKPAAVDVSKGSISSPSRSDWRSEFKESQIKARELIESFKKAAVDGHSGFQPDSLAAGSDDDTASCDSLKGEGSRTPSPSLFGGGDESGQAASDDNPRPDWQRGVSQSKGASSQSQPCNDREGGSGPDLDAHNPTFSA
jgi:hypothetical protein